jgi:hypothetical protein
LEETQKSAAECPVAPPSRSTVYARTLHRACEILGGVPQLAAHLEVREADLQRWLEGDEDPPLEVFLAAVDAVLLHADSGGRA